MTPRYAQKVQAEMAKLPFLRDLQFAQELNYPDAGHQHRSRTRRTVRPDHGGRRRAPSCRPHPRPVSPSRTTGAIPISGNAFQIQVQLPQNRMQSVDELGTIPVMQNARGRNRA